MLNSWLFKDLRALANLASNSSIPLPFSENWSTYPNNMEVDTSQGSSSRSLECYKPPQIDSNPGSPKSPKDRLIDLLDQVEMHVERLRRDALKLEEEKDTLMTTLDTLRNSDLMVELTECDREDVVHYSGIIAGRCHTIEVLVRTTRDQTQEESLHQVNSFIDGLVVSLKTDPGSTKVRCLSYMNACSSQFQGASDKMFEAAILGCTLDDQKRVKKRLQGLLDYIDKMTNQVFCQSTSQLSMEDVFSDEEEEATKCFIEPISDE